MIERLVFNSIESGWENVKEAANLWRSEGVGDTGVTRQEAAKLRYDLFW